MSQYDQRALIEGIFSTENPPLEAMAIIGTMSGIITSELGGATTAKMLRMCADLAERWPSQPVSPDQLEAALKEFLQ